MRLEHNVVASSRLVQIDVVCGLPTGSLLSTSIACCHLNIKHRLLLMLVRISRLTGSFVAANCRPHLRDLKARISWFLSAPQVGKLILNGRRR
jgi:hypothetical protein